MPNKIRVWKREELVKFNLVDCSDRPLPMRDIVAVKCEKCHSIGMIRFALLRSKMISYGKTWVCKKCLNADNAERGKVFVGEKNPFYGKAHDKESRKKMKTSSRKRWDNTPEEKRKAVGESIRKSFLDKYKKENPMNVFVIKDIHREAMKELFEREGFIEERNKKIKKTNQALYGVDFYVQSDDIKKKIQEKYGEGGPFSDVTVRNKAKRTNLLKYATENPLNSENIQEKIKKTNLLKYGSENVGSVEEIKEKIKATVLEKYGTESFFASDQFKQMKRDNNWSVSKGELEVGDFLASLGLHWCKTHINGIEIDLYIPSLGIGIEYHGLYWHSELHHEKNYHLTKYNNAKKSNIVLIQVFEHEWKKRNEQVKSRLRSVFKKNETTVGARECEIKEVDVKQASDFIDKNHIQKFSINTTKSIGLFFKEELIGVAAIGFHHRYIDKLTLNRFCCKDGYTIAGGLSRVSKFASNLFKADIISWCDLRWSDGNGYLKAGWEQEAVLRPDYFYTNFTKVFSKQSRRKSKTNTPDRMTEHEHALLDGLYRVYDCGKIRFVYRYKENI